MDVLRAIKRLLYRLVPLLAYTDRLEEENVTLRAQLTEAQRFIYDITRRAYFPETSENREEPRVVSEEALGGYVRRRERASLDKYLKSMDAGSLEDYEAEIAKRTVEAVTE